MAIIIWINKILACFDPVVTERRKKELKATKSLGRDVEKLIFKMGGVAAILDYLSAHLAILCLLGALMLIINWIIEMSKI